MVLGQDIVRLVMNSPAERDRLRRRWYELEARIADLHAGQTVEGGPAETEGNTATRSAQYRATLRRRGTTPRLNSPSELWADAACDTMSAIPASRHVQAVIRMPLIAPMPTILSLDS